MFTGGLLGKPLRSSKLKCRSGTEDFGIPPYIITYETTSSEGHFYILQQAKKSLTKYSSINGCIIVGSRLPTIATVNVEGSLKLRSKYSQAFSGSTFGRSLSCAGYKRGRELRTLISNIRFSSPLVTPTP